MSSKAEKELKKEAKILFWDATWSQDLACRVTHLRPRGRGGMSPCPEAFFICKKN